MKKTRTKWTPEMDELLRQKYPTAHLDNLAMRLGVTRTALMTRANVLGVVREVNVKHPWTRRQVDYLRKHYATAPIADLVAHTQHGARSIFQKAKALGLSKDKEFFREAGRKCAKSPRSIATRFKKGQAPANKGKRQEDYMSPEAIAANAATRFKPGEVPQNIKPIGHERVDKYGKVWIKVAHGQRMVLKHRYVWEQANGPIPPGHRICFRDGDSTNCDIANLYIMSREEAARQLILNETPQQRAARMQKIKAKRDETIRRDRLRIRWGLEPLSGCVTLPYGKRETKRAP